MSRVRLRAAPCAQMDHQRGGAHASPSARWLASRRRQARRGQCGFSKPARTAGRARFVGGSFWPSTAARRAAAQRAVLGYTSRPVSGTVMLGSTNEFVGYDTRQRAKAARHLPQRDDLMPVEPAQCRARVGALRPYSPKTASGCEGCRLRDRERARGRRRALAPSVDFIWPNTLQATARATTCGFSRQLKAHSDT